MTKAEVFMQYLKDEGYSPSLDKDGDVLFKFEGGSYYLIANENDPMFFQVLFPNFWTIKAPDELDKVCRAAVDASRRTKVAKVYVSEAKDRVSAAVEVYIKEPTDCRVFLMRSLAAIRHAVKEFAEALAK